MFLLSYLHDLSDVRLCEEVAMHAGFRWFCRLNFDDSVPDRTTLVKLRQKWGEAGVFEDLMREVVRQCIEAGLVRGVAVGVDGTMVTANAATNSLSPLAPVESLDGYLQRIRHQDLSEAEQVTEQKRKDGDEPPSGPTSPDTTQGRKAGDPNFRGQRLTNESHRSKTDRDARLYRKGGAQEAKLRYLVHDLADLV